MQVDKLGRNSLNGDPSSALLEVRDHSLPTRHYCPLANHAPLLTTRYPRSTTDHLLPTLHY